MYNLIISVLFGEVTKTVSAITTAEDITKESTAHINIISFIPKTGSTTIKSGESLELWCNVDDHWEWCTFSHVPSGKFCDFQWKNDPYNVTVNECDSFEGMSEFLGDYNKHECGIRILHIDQAESGEWRCDLRLWDRAETVRGLYPEYQVAKSFEVHVTSDGKVVKIALICAAVMLVLVASLAVFLLKTKSERIPRWFKRASNASSSSNKNDTSEVAGHRDKVYL